MCLILLWPVWQCLVFCCVSDGAVWSWSFFQDSPGVLSLPALVQNHFPASRLNWCSKCVSAKCFCLSLDVFLSRHRCTSSARVAMVTPGSPRLLHPGWSQKVNGAEWSVDLLNTPAPGEGAAARFDWLNHILHHLLSRQVPGWIGHHRHGDWGNDTLSHTHSRRLRNETGFHERVAAQSDSMKSCLSDEETAAWIELSLEWNSALLLHPSERKRTALSFSFSLSNVNLSF